MAKPTTTSEGVLGEAGRGRDEQVRMEVLRKLFPEKKVVHVGQGVRCLRVVKKEASCNDAVV
jgi:hypothetical protein